MLEHLISSNLEPLVCPAAADAFVGLDRSSVGDIIDAQHNTAAWLEETGLADPNTKVNIGAARAAFTALTVGATEEEQKSALTTLHLPEEIRHIVGMLTAYDWEFVHQARELRGFVVAKLIEESTGAPRPGDRIKALTALGKVTEVGLFTEKIEVKKTDMTDDEINARIRDKISAFLKIEDAVTHDPAPTDVTPIPKAPCDAEPS